MFLFLLRNGFLGCAIFFSFVHLFVSIARYAALCAEQRSKRSINAGMDDTNDMQKLRLSIAPRCEKSARRIRNKIH